MIEWSTVAAFSCLLSGALFLVAYPLHKSKGFLCVLIPAALVGVLLAYGFWGAFPAWQSFHHRQVKQHEAHAILQSIGGPEVLIQQMKARLDKAPSAEGWYLLGKLYLNQQDNAHALEAFSLAHKLKPQDEQITLHYVQSILDAHHALDKNARQLLRSILQKNANQPDTLAMLAMDAFTAHHYQIAIAYWEHLLALVSPQSEEANAIRQAIAKARGRLN